jgi:asparagine synthetase B (glutamine-hydrolysing)
MKSSEPCRCAGSGWYLGAGQTRDVSQLADMSRAITRGPDDQGTYSGRAAGVALAHRRLSIIVSARRGISP